MYTLVCYAVGMRTKIAGALIALGVIACGHIITPVEDREAAAIASEDGGAPIAAIEGGASAATPILAASGSPSSVPSSAPADADAAGGSAPCVPIDHDNGAGQIYRSCAPLGVYTEDSAKRACGAWIAGAPGAICHLAPYGSCTNKAIVGSGMPGGTTSTWDFAGQAPGKVAIASGGWLCPAITEIDTWN